MASGDLRRPLVDSSVILCLLFFPECTGKVKREICMPPQTPGALITPPVFISPLKRSTSRRARRSRRDKIHRAARTRRPDVDARRRVRLRVINVRFSHVKKKKKNFAFVQIRIQIVHRKFSHPHANNTKTEENLFLTHIM